jgi:hypothetical protein
VVCSTPAAKADYENTPLIAALKRCATQNQNPALPQNQIQKQVVAQPVDGDVWFDWFSTMFVTWR